MTARRARARARGIPWGRVAQAATPLLVATGASTLAPDWLCAALCCVVGAVAMAALVYGFVPLAKR